TWPNYRNRARFFKETSIPENLNIFPVFPKGYERFQPNSVNFIRWLSAVPNHPQNPSFVKIEFSANGPNGPFITLTDSFPNTGFYQWQIPNVISNNCYLKLTLITSTDTVSTLTIRPFAIGTTSDIRNYEDYKTKLKNFCEKKTFNINGQEVKKGKLKKGVYFIKENKKIKKLVIIK
ncbi:MAG: hypothetical protein ABIK56_02880, partial [candidate division WOR-3 bacterium]